jgi:hypothetical protein
VSRCLARSPGTSSLRSAPDGRRRCKAALRMVRPDDIAYTVHRAAPRSPGRDADARRGWQWLGHGRAPT